MDRRCEEFAAQSGLGSEWLTSLPTSGVGQSCALCDAAEVRWVHALEPTRVRYRVYGKGHTLPSFWMLCARCERLYTAGDHEALLTLMLSAPSWESFTVQQIDECVRQPLAVFVRADLGAVALPPP